MRDKQLFSAALERRRPIVIDGGLATQCESMGCDISGNLWSAALLQSDPRAIVDAHRAFLDAGAEIIITASYQASRDAFAGAGFAAEDADELILSSVSLAVQARDEYLRDNPQSPTMPLVAASIGPYGAALHDGSEYTGRYGVTADVLREFHADRLELLDASPADVLACETIPSFEEAQVLAELMREARSPGWVSFTCSDDEHICDGTPIETTTRLFRDHPRVLAVGVNCTAPEYILPLVERISNAIPGKPIVVYPNSGEAYDAADKSWSGEVSSTEWSAAASAWVAAGARLVGGCCRVGADRIHQLAEGLGR